MVVEGNTCRGRGRGGGGPEGGAGRWVQEVCGGVEGEGEGVWGCGGEAGVGRGHVCGGRLQLDPSTDTKKVPILKKVDSAIPPPLPPLSPTPPPAYPRACRSPCSIVSRALCVMRWLVVPSSFCSRASASWHAKVLS